MKQRTFTFGEIKDLWDAYRKAMAVRILKGGVWSTELAGGQIGHIDGTRAERVKAHTVMSFPDYLEKTGNVD